MINSAVNSLVTLTALGKPLYGLAAISHEAHAA